MFTNFVQNWLALWLHFEDLSTQPQVRLLYYSVVSYRLENLSVYVVTYIGDFPQVPFVTF